MLITEETKDYAIVQRQLIMLKNLSDHKYKNTLAFSIFSAMMCWIAQKIRNNNGDIISKINLIEGMPSFEKTKIKWDGNFYRNQGDIIVCIRNALAHADERAVRPLNNGSELTGFALELQSNDVKKHWVNFDHNQMVCTANYFGELFLGFVAGLNPSSESDAKELKENP